MGEEKAKPTGAALVAASMSGKAKRITVDVTGYELDGETYWLTSDGTVLNKFCVVRDLAPGVYVVEEYQAPLKRFANKVKAFANVVLKAADLTPLGGLLAKVLGPKAVEVVKAIAVANPEEAALSALIRLFGAEKLAVAHDEIQKALADGVLTAGELEAVAKKIKG